MKNLPAFILLSAFAVSASAAPRIAGDPSAKSTVSVSDVPAGAKVQWLLAEKESGPYAPLQGVTGERQVLPASFTGKWTKARVMVADGKVEETAPVKIKAVDGNPNVAFMHKHGWGLSFTFDREYIHRSAANDAERIHQGADGKYESWDSVLATFDVEAFADEVQSTGADFVQLALGQNSGYYCAPNATYEGYVGCAPNTYCSKRDLAGEVMRALKRRGIATMLYLPGNPPTHQQEIRRKLDYPGRGDSSPGPRTREKWDRVITEWSLRYGADLAGWWIDGMYDHNAYDMKNEPNWHSRAAALKAGNPARAITFGGCRPSGSPYEDYYNGETLPWPATPADGQWKNEDPVTRALSPAVRGDFPGPWWIGKERRMQWLAYMPVTNHPVGGWGGQGTTCNPKSLNEWLVKVRAKGGVVMLDGKVSRFGHIDPDQLKLYRATPACRGE